MQLNVKEIFLLLCCVPVCRDFCCVRRPALHSHSFSVLFCSDLATSRPTGCAQRKQKGACKSSWRQIGSLKSFYTDNSLEFGKACEDLSWNQCTSTPHRSETNGIAERAVRIVKKRHLCCIVAIRSENWWADSMECYTYLRNIEDLLPDGKTPYESRFGEPFKDPSFRLVHWFSITL